MQGIMLMKCFKFYLPIKNSIRLQYFSQNINNGKINAYAILKPYLDFDERLLKIKQLENNISLREIDIKLPSLISMWKHYKNVLEDIRKLEKERARISKELTLITNSNDNDRIQSLKFSGIKVREDLKKLKLVLGELEEQVYPAVLQLPNELSEVTNEILYSNDMQATGGEDHLTVGKKFNILDYLSPTTYFLKGPAAIFELDVCNKVFQLFKDKGFIQFSNPDFIRNTIVKYLNLDGIQSLILLNKIRGDEEFDRLNLHGGASALPFCIYHSKSIVDHTNLPVLYVTKGRHYAYSQLSGLYGVWQNTSVQIFIGTKEKSVNYQINSVIDTLNIFYKSFKIPLRIVYCKPTELSHSECTRISFQTYSCIFKHYVELGNISFYSDYISKRLRMYYSEQDENKFLQIISGTVVTIPPLLAAVLEHVGGEYIVKNYFVNKYNNN